jgi:two-component sensor histidine kinase
MKRGADPLRVTWATEPTGPAILKAGSVLLVVVGCAIWGIWAYVEERERAVEQAYENVALIRQYAARLVQTQTILQDAAAIYARTQPGIERLRTREFHEFLAQIEGTQSFTHGLAVVAVDGTMVASSRAFPVNYSFGERDYLSAVTNGAWLFLDRIALQPSGQDAMVVVQPFMSGDFQGAIVSAVGVEAIRDFLKGVAGEYGEAASLLREDGKLLVRHVPSQPIYLDESAPAREAMRRGPIGHYEARAISDGTNRIYAYGKLENLPIYANFGVPTSTLVSQWFWGSLPVWLLLLAGGAFSFSLAEMIQRSLRDRLATEEQKQLRLAAEQRAEQHERFMRELNHRVKNNLTLVDSLIGIQMRKRGSLDGGQLRARVRAIADVHDLLYKATDSYHVDLGELLEHLCRSSAIVPDELGIEVSCDTSGGVIVEAGKATALALIVVELLTNAVKHAFPDDRKGKIRVKLARQGVAAELTSADNGVGIPETPTRSSGIKIVEAFVQQVGGTLSQSNDAGAVFTIDFPLGSQDED